MKQRIQKVKLVHNSKFEKSSFKKDIEELIYKLDVNYLDAIIEWCRINNFDLEYAATLVKRNKDILDILENEAHEIHALKKSNLELDTTE